MGITLEPFGAYRRPHHAPALPRLEVLEDRCLLDHGLAQTLPVVTGAAPPLKEIVAFGDSLTDTGNDYLASHGALPPSPPYFQGHFSNGPVWVEYLADRLGLPRPAPFLAGGTNYAFGNAETGAGFSTDGHVPNVGTQIDAYLAAHTFHPDQLVTLWAGANDFLHGGQTRPGVPVLNLVRHIVTLAAAGATNILVPNLPPLGLLPALRDHPLPAAFLNLETVAFDTLLDAALDRLDQLPGLNIIRLDVFGLVLEGAADPSALGFTNITDTALRPDGTVVPNPDEYLWWDNVHPTTAGHRIIGDAAAAATSQVMVLTPNGIPLRANGESVAATERGPARVARDAIFATAGADQDSTESWPTGGSASGPRRKKT